MLLPEEPEIDEFEFLRKNGAYHYDSKQSVAYTRSLFKTAALFFDRIYIDRFDYVTLRYKFDQRLSLDALYLNDHITAGIAQYMDSPVVPSRDSEKHAFTFGAMEQAAKQGVELTPIYGTLHRLESSADLASKDQVRTFELALSCFPMVEEGSLDWEQVDEFRSDVASIGGFRAARNLLADISKCKSSAEANDVIEKRMEEYKEACRKHGATLFKSSFNMLSNKDTLIGAVATAALSGDLVMGAVVGGLKLSADLTINLVESVRDRRMLSSKHSTGALAIELRRLEGDIGK